MRRSKGDNPAARIIDECIQEDAALVKEARHLAMVEDDDPRFEQLTKRELLIRDAARKGSAHVPWFLAEAAANARILGKAMVEEEYSQGLAGRAPVVLIVAPQAQIDEWAERALALQSNNDEEKRLNAIDVAVQSATLPAEAKRETG